MKKLIIIILVLICLLLTTSCKVKKDGEISDNYFAKSLYATDTVYQCLRDKNAGSIKELLCDRLKSLPDVDEQIQDLLDSIDGNLLLMDMDSVRSVEKSSAAKDNDVWTEIYTIGKIRDLKTDTGKQYQELLVFYCYVDEDLPDLEGIYAICLIEKEGATPYYIRMPDEILNQKSPDTSS